MEKQSTQNIQDAFLNTARRDKQTINFNLMNGEKLSGRIKSFDKFCVLIDLDGEDFLLFKHAISTVSYDKTSNGNTKSSNSNVQVKYLGRKVNNS